MIASYPAAVSRGFASGAVLTSGNASAGDLTLWLAGLSACAVACPSEDGLSPIDVNYRLASDFGSVPVRSMLDLTRADRVSTLSAAIRRLQETRAHLIGMDDGDQQAMLGWETTAQHETGELTTIPLEPAISQMAALHYPGILIAEAHVANDVEAREPRQPILFDLADIAGFRSRYSVMLYLRALAWLSGNVPLKQHWKRRFVGNTRVEMRVPVPDAGLLMGITGLKRRVDIERLALTPAKADLAKVGINLSHEWIPVPGYERICGQLAITASISQAQPREAKPQPVRKVKLTPRTPRAA